MKFSLENKTLNIWNTTTKIYKTKIHLNRTKLYSQMLFALFLLSELLKLSSSSWKSLFIMRLSQSRQVTLKQYFTFDISNLTLHQFCQWPIEIVSRFHLFVRKGKSHFFLHFLPTFFSSISNRWHYLFFLSLFPTFNLISELEYKNAKSTETISFQTKTV